MPASATKPTPPAPITVRVTCPACFAELMLRRTDPHLMIRDSDKGDELLFRCACCRSDVYVAQKRFAPQVN